MGINFQWDPLKAEVNLLKHGVAFDEAKTVFADAASLTVEDPRHSQLERRQITLGMSDRQRLLAVAFTERPGAIRIISARPANRREWRLYDEA